MSPDPIAFLERPMPSANAVLVRGERPVLIDGGLGAPAEVAALEVWLRAEGAPPETLGLVVNTHHHSDHVGANARLAGLGARIAAHRWEADLVNRDAPEAWSAAWLDQPVEPYRVDVLLAGGEELDGGLHAVHTPGHTLGHLAFWHPASATLIVGDTVHRRDVAWLNPFLEGAGAIDRLLGSLDLLATFPARVALTGHGPPLLDVAGELRAATERLRKWQADPEKMWWHGAKRILAYALMLRGGLAEDELEPYLLARPWVHDYARHAFRVAPGEFARLLIAEMERSGAARWEGGRLQATLPHGPTDPAWLAAALARRPGVSGSGSGSGSP